MTNEQLNELGAEILDACIEVHRILGPGLLESAYENALLEEFLIRNINCQSQVPIELIYKNKNISKGYVLDMVIEDEIILELKAVENLLPIFEAQLYTYLKLSDRKLGYSINFNVPLLKNGFKRMVYKF